MNPAPAALPRRAAPPPAPLADPAGLAARRAALDAPPLAPRLAPLRALAARIAAEVGAPVPDPDPADGGTGARCLLLLETPGPSTVRTGLVSRDVPTPTGANLRRFLATSGLARGDTLLWNAVPWSIHAPGARNRAPTAAERAAGLAWLPDLLALLPDLRAVVLAGRVAGGAAPLLARLRPDLPVLAMPHPSPTIVCTAPAVGARIAAALAGAAALLAAGERS